MLSYLSPTSISLWDLDRTEFYLKYVAAKKPAPIPQTQPMAVGSAFDAYVKAELVAKLFGTTVINGVNYSLDHLLEMQVEPHMRDWARIAGAEAMALYKATGALADLVLELEAATSEPRFEFTVQGEIGGVPFLGRPDLFFRTTTGCMILDWKVNGWCAKKTSPAPGYLKCRKLGGKTKTHKDTVAMLLHGIMVNVASNLEKINISWATQETIYAWLMDADSDFIAGIEQIVGRDRVSTLRCRVSREFQQSLLERAQIIWERVQRGHIFDEDNDARCAILEEYTESYEKDTSLHRDWLEGVIRGSC